MENVRSENMKAMSLYIDVMDIAKAESLFKGRMVKKPHFGYMVESPMLFNDFIRMLLQNAIAGVKETVQIRKRAAELKEATYKTHKATLERAIKREEAKVAERRKSHTAKCLTSADIDKPHKKCYDPAKKTILLGRSNTAMEEVPVEVNENEVKGRKYLLVPLTAEWRDRLLTVKGGKVVGHAARVSLKCPDGREWVWKVRDVRAGNVTYSFRAFAADGRVPSKGIIASYFAVLFTGWCKTQFPERTR